MFVQGEQRMLGALEDTMPGRSLAKDLGSGDAGCLPRIGLSLGAAAGLLAMALFFSGAMEQLGRRSDGFPRVDDEFARDRLTGQCVEHPCS